LLSPRQREVATLLAAGLINKEIGLVLQIGERTVESHVEAILRKLGFQRRTQIGRWAGERNLGTGGQPPYN
jgi:DNA-binding NarL/FixJ family response regulator